jgi:16S rRNA (uracil1498-N3)-methyltransferase
MHLFHCPDLGKAVVELPQEEAHHAINVLRLQAGHVIGLLDGKGMFAEAEITETTKRGCALHVLRKERKDRNVRPAST